MTHAAAKGPQGAQKGEPARQHERPRAGAEYAGRGEATGISQVEKPGGMAENLRRKPSAWTASPATRKKLEQEMGCPVISAENAKTMKLVTDIIEDAAKLTEKGEE